MLLNYIFSSLRSIIRYKSYFLLNIAGLTLALAFSIMILLHIRVETSYDNYFEDKERIYRITQKGGDGKHWAVISPPLGENFKNFMSEVEEYCSFRDMHGGVLKAYNESQDLIPHEYDQSFFVDSNVLNVFKYDVIDGDRSKPFDNPDGIILTESYAKKMFGRADVAGETIYTLNDEPLIISSVIQDIPFNSHMHFDCLRPMQVFKNNFVERGLTEWLESRGWMAVYTYVKLKDGASFSDMNQKIPDFMADYWSVPDSLRSVMMERAQFVLQPLNKIHFNPRLTQDTGPRNDIKYIYIFALVAFVVLAIAAVNYVNLTIAIALNRTKEVGIRKVIGARKEQLIWQFMVEAFLLIFLSFIFALLIILMILPFYNNITSYSLSGADIFSFQNVSIMLITAFVLYLFSSIYPAVVSSGFRPLQTIKGYKDKSGRINSIRKSLIVVQFVMSIFMIFSTLVIYQQIEYFHKKDLGFQKDHLLVYTFYGDLRNQIYSNFAAYKEEFKKNPAVLSVSSTSCIPGDHYSVEAIVPEGRDENYEPPSMRVMRVDRDFLQTMDIELLKGRDFAEVSRDSGMFIINEAAVEALDLENPVGTTANNVVFNVPGEIVGVVKNYNFSSLHDNIESLALEIRPGLNRYCLIRISGDNIPATLDFIDATLNQININAAFDYQFLEDRLTHLYKSEKVVSQIFRVFGFIAVFISCLGLFGMSSLAAYRKKKEVSIRKILGASSKGLFVLLTSQFVKWILIANVIALPLAFLAMKAWLENFAYHINISAGIYLATLILSILIAILSILSQTLKVVRTNPAEVLRQD